MRILLVITGLGVGGAERQVADLADAFSLLGHEVVIAYLTGGVKVHPKSDIALHYLGAEKSMSGLFLALFRLCRLIDDFRPDVVHGHMFHANLLARCASLLKTTPRLVCSAHSNNEGGWWRMLAYRLTHRLADVSTNVSREAVIAFEKKGAVPRGGMLVVSNGIDITRFCGSLNTESRQESRLQEGVATNEKLVIAVGRLAEAKDFPNLFCAWEQLTRSRSNIKLWIVGDGELRPQLESLASRLGIANTVSFMGVRDDIPNLMNAADLFVLSSAWEGFSLVTAEAMACGKVSVVTDSGGVKDVIGGCGFLVPPRDSGRLAEALDRALNLSDGEASSLGEQARNRVLTCFSLGRVVDEWLDIYTRKIA